MNYLKSDKWVLLSGKPIKDIESHILSKLEDGRYSFHVGTDSKSYLDHTVVITTICFREPSAGALVAYQKSKISNFSGIVEKLIHETLVSLEAAATIQDITGLSPTIHADVNVKKEALSNRALNVIVGLVTGMGYPIRVKPDAWAADIADMFTR
ncbi:MAG: hypothetical protein NZ811_05295 [Gammaproteobacteria bacterium]|nr:hypothetical protein [Gammaproteobacteria bacterium]